MTPATQARGEFSHAFVERICTRGESEDQLPDSWLDPRLVREASRSTLQREFHELSAWMLRCLETHEVLTRETEHVLALLPAHGVTTHVLRRAVPFAALCIPTTVVLHPSAPSGSATVVAELAIALGLQGVLECWGGAPADAVERYDALTTRFVVTGREATLRALRESRLGQVVGATGRCLIALARGDDEAKHLEGLLRAKPSLPGSCTTLGAVLVHEEGDQFRPLGSNTSLALDQLLQQFHPSIVISRIPVASLCLNTGGYRVVPCDESGATDTLSGFARDPRWGWAGDYSIETTGCLHG